jgi:hypothetical protein
MINGMMMGTGQPGEGGRPPVDVQKEVFDQITRPITVVASTEKPFTDPANARTLLSLAVRNGAILDGALARIHDTFFAHGQKDLRREMLNCTLYLLPPMPDMFGVDVSEEGASPPPHRVMQLALAVAGDQLVFGQVSGVEQAIRDVQRTDLESITTDPMYQHASRWLPAQAGVYFYQNNQLEAEATWAMLRKAGRDAARKKAGPKSDAGSDKDGGTNQELEFSAPQMALVQALEKYVDFTALPDFEMIRRYFGATVGFLRGDDEGISFEVVTVKPPSAGPEGP